MKQNKGLLVVIADDDFYLIHHLPLVIVHKRALPLPSHPITSQFHINSQYFPSLAIHSLLQVKSELPRVIVVKNGVPTPPLHPVCSPDSRLSVCKTLLRPSAEYHKYGELPGVQGRGSGAIENRHIPRGSCYGRV